jgi:hypothetical protein
MTTYGGILARRRPELPTYAVIVRSASRFDAFVIRLDHDLVDVRALVRLGPEALDGVVDLFHLVLMIFHDGAARKA